MNVLTRILFGSNLYGTNTENSDKDYKGIYLPSAKEICLNSYKRSINVSTKEDKCAKNSNLDTDEEYFSLDKFMNLLCEGQTVALDMLFSPEFKNNSILTELYDNRFKILNKKVNAFVGYTKQQAAKYGVKGFRVHALSIVLEALEGELDNNITIGELDLEGLIKKWDNSYIKLVNNQDTNCHAQKFLEVCEKKMSYHLKIKEAYNYCKKRYEEYGHRAIKAKENSGIDWKAVSHAVRISKEAEELLLTGYITFPRPERELLIKIKTGQMEFNKVSKLIEEGLELINKAVEKSRLIEQPDYEWCSEFVYRTYNNIVKGG